MTIQERILVLNNAILLLQDSTKLNKKSIHKQANIQCGYEHFTRFIGVSKTAKGVKINTKYYNSIKETDTFNNVYNAVMLFLETKLSLTFDAQSHCFINLEGEKTPLDRFNYNNNQGDVQQPVNTNNSWLINTYASLSIDMIRTLISQSMDIEILQTFFSHISDFEKTFRQVLENKNSHIKILLFQPHTEIVQLRKKGLSKENVSSILWNNIQSLVRLSADFPHQFSFRMYNTLPGFAFYKCDNVYITGFQWFNRYNHNGSFLEIDANSDSPFVKHLKDHWKALWAYSQPKTIETFSPKKKALKYNAYFQFDNELQTAELYIDPINFDLLLSRTQSGLLYSGSIIDLGNSCCNIVLRHNIDASFKLNSSHEIVGIAHTSVENIGVTELVLGMRVINHPHFQNISASKFLLENTEPALSSKITDKEKLKLIKMFFSNQKLIESTRISWLDLRRFYHNKT